MVTMPFWTVIWTGPIPLAFGRESPDATKTSQTPSAQASRSLPSAAANGAGVEVVVVTDVVVEEVVAFTDVDGLSAEGAGSAPHAATTTNGTTTSSLCSTELTMPRTL
jgi:hypothetical protein